MLRYLHHRCKHPAYELVRDVRMKEITHTVNKDPSGLPPPKRLLKHLRDHTDPPRPLGTLTLDQLREALIRATRTAKTMSLLHGKTVSAPLAYFATAAGRVPDLAWGSIPPPRPFNLSFTHFPFSCVDYVHSRICEDGWWNHIS